MKRLMIISIAITIIIGHWFMFDEHQRVVTGPFLTRDDCVNTLPDVQRKLNNRAIKCGETY